MYPKPFKLLLAFSKLAEFSTISCHPQQKEEIWVQESLHSLRMMEVKCYYNIQVLILFNELFNVKYVSWFKITLIDIQPPWKMLPKEQARGTMIRTEFKLSDGKQDWLSFKVPHPYPCLHYSYATSLFLHIVFTKFWAFSILAVIKFWLYLNMSTTRIYSHIYHILSLSIDLPLHT